MINYYKYLPTSEKDESWGLYVLSAGCNRIKQHETYPSSTHPAHHYFDWNKGRILDEYQLIYISNGTGTFESFNCGQHTVNAGTVIFLFPGEWHRFRPNKETGWDEFWVGFKGPVMDNLIVQNFFTKENAVLEIGSHDIVIRLLSDIIEKTKEERSGYQPLVAGIVMHFLGVIHSLTRYSTYAAEDKTEAVIERARMILRSNIVENIAMEEVAEELNVSYAWFRKAFKAYTGIAPHQYLMQLRIEKAKEYLADGRYSVKEIAHTLNFESTFYFSRLFKEKTSVSPEIYRKSIADKEDRSYDL